MTNALGKAKKQSGRIILDLTDCPKPIEQIADRPNAVIKEIILIKNDEVIRRMR